MWSIRQRIESCQSYYNKDFHNISNHITDNINNHSIELSNNFPVLHSKANSTLHNNTTQNYHHRFHNIHHNIHNIQIQDCCKLVTHQGYYTNVNASILLHKRNKTDIHSDMSYDYSLETFQLHFCILRIVDNEVYLEKS